MSHQRSQEFRVCFLRFTHSPCSSSFRLYCKWWTPGTEFEGSIVADLLSAEQGTIFKQAGLRNPVPVSSWKPASYSKHVGTRVSVASFCFLCRLLLYVMHTPVHTKSLFTALMNSDPAKVHKRRNFFTFGTRNIVAHAYFAAMLDGLFTIVMKAKSGFFHWSLGKGK